jgi:CBS domain-containing protein
VSTANRPLDAHRAPRLEHVRVADVMHPGVMTCPAETMLREVARMMATHRIHCVAVPDAPGGAVSSWGVVSDLDVVAAAAAGDVESRTAGEIAGTEALAISDDESIDRVVQLMSEHALAHLVVVGAASGRPVGVISTLDVAGLLSWSDS